MKFAIALALLLGLGFGFDLLVFWYDGYFHFVAAPWFAVVAAIACIINQISVWLGKSKKFWW